MLPNAAPTASRLLNQPSSGERPARESTLLAQPSGGTTKTRPHPPNERSGLDDGSGDAAGAHQGVDRDALALGSLDGPQHRPRPLQLEPVQVRDDISTR